MQAAEAVSVGVVQPEDTMLMYGSTAFYIGVTRERVSGTKMWSNPYTIDNQYCCTGGMATTGSLTKWIRDEMAKEFVAQEEAGGENAYTVLFERQKIFQSEVTDLLYFRIFRGKECRFRIQWQKAYFSD